MRLNSVDTERHLFVNRVIVDEFNSLYCNQEEFVSNMFQHWSTWPRFDERMICFDTTDINKKLSLTKKIEQCGIERIFDCLLGRNIHLDYF